ncbi:MAG: DUF2764 domain-containing protein [Bacteroidaceae bacterium]|nr:DUF2764 domain-containing protein [Bacteroidaceae bacterium]
MSNYYCLIAGLPDISLDGNMKDYTISRFKEECNEVITDRDAKLLFYFFLKIDCMNLVRLLKNPDAELIPNGNYTIDQFRDMITSAREMNFNVHRYPSFMSAFAREYTYNKDKEGWFAEDAMSLAYYEYAMQCPNKMISDWFKFNFNITNILTALIARKNGWNVGDYILGDNAVNEMIRTNNTKDFDLQHEYDYVGELMKIVEEKDPVRKEKSIDAFKWQWLEEKTIFEVFSIEAVFAYFCKLEIMERWELLDIEKGKETFKQIIENLRGEAKVPEEFIR